MYETRQKRLMNYVQSELKVDVALIIAPINIYYYTGFHSNPHERFFMLAVNAKQEKTTLFLPSLDKQAAQNAAHVNKFIAMYDNENAYEKFAEHLGAASSFAFEKNDVTVSQYEQLKTYYPQASFTDVGRFIQSERLNKSVSEIEHVKRAIKITEQGLENTLPKIERGMTELEVKAELEYQLTVLGSEGLAFDTIVLSGEKSALPHGRAGERILQDGDFLLFDFGVFVNGYCSDITRTFLIGEGTKEQVAMYETVLAANKAAIARVKIGDPLKYIDLAARELITSRNYGEYFTHRIGHGLGLDVHEEPSIHHENEEIVERGLLFTIEPGVYVPGVGGVRIEDNLYINEDGEVDVLTSYPKELKTI